MYTFNILYSYLKFYEPRSARRSQLIRLDTGVIKYFRNSGTAWGLIAGFVIVLLANEKLSFTWKSKDKVLIRLIGFLA